MGEYGLVMSGLRSMPAQETVDALERLDFRPREAADAQIIETDEDQVLREDIAVAAYQCFTPSHSPNRQNTLWISGGVVQSTFFPRQRVSFNPGGFIDETADVWLIVTATFATKIDATTLNEYRSGGPTAVDATILVTSAPPLFGWSDTNSDIKEAWQLAIIRKPDVTLAVERHAAHFGWLLTDPAGGLRLYGINPITFPPLGGLTGA